MNDQHGKFILNFLTGLYQPKSLFLVWFAICAIFLLLILSYYRKVNRRNFRGDGEGTGPKVRVDARRLVETTENRAMTVKKKNRVGVKTSYPKGPP